MSLEEEGEEEEEVRDSEAEVEDGGGHLPNFRDQHVQDGHVGWDPDNNSQQINNGERQLASAIAQSQLGKAPGLHPLKKTAAARALHIKNPATNKALH